MLEVHLLWIQLLPNLGGGFDVDTKGFAKVDPLPNLAGSLVALTSELRFVMFMGQCPPL